MKPIAALAASEARRLKGLLFDLDDTLLDHGKLTVGAYRALHRLADSGLELVAVTGRPVGFGEVLARQWPVRAVVAENGALASFRRESGPLGGLDRVGPEERQRRRKRLEAFSERLLKEFPALRPADDTHLRVSDYSFDIGEHATVDRETIERARALSHQHGFQTTLSSVHLHLTTDGDDKASGSVHVLGKLLGVDSTTARFEFAFIGDSENDASCFAAFQTTIAVANFRGEPTVPPRYVTSEARGAGFAEAADVLIRRREE